MIHYINFYSNNIEYDENYNRPPEEIEPIPVWWLEKKCRKMGSYIVVKVKSVIDIVHLIR